MNADGTAHTLNDHLRWSARSTVQQTNDLIAQIGQTEAQLERLRAHLDSYGRLLIEYQELGIDRGIWADRAAMAADIGQAATDAAVHS